MFSHKNNSHRMIEIYHDVLRSILAECSDERWTGFGRMPSLAASLWASTVLHSSSGNGIRF
jgi:hypothetical protein